MWSSAHPLLNRHFCLRKKKYADYNFFFPLAFTLYVCCLSVFRVEITRGKTAPCQEWTSRSRWRQIESAFLLKPQGFSTAAIRAVPEETGRRELIHQSVSRNEKTLPWRSRGKRNSLYKFSPHWFFRSKENNWMFSLFFSCPQGNSPIGDKRKGSIQYCKHSNRAKEPKVKAEPNFLANHQG